MTCPCGTGSPYAACCGPLLDGGPEATAPTAEALMRSRYTAFARADPAYLLRSWHSSTRPERIELDPAQEWVQLEVLSATGGLFDTEGTVAFRATWRQRGRTDVVVETSRFVREDGRWVYLTALPTGR